MCIACLSFMSLEIGHWYERTWTHKMLRQYHRHILATIVYGLKCNNSFPIPHITIWYNDLSNLIIVQFRFLQIGFDTIRQTNCKNKCELMKSEFLLLFFFLYFIIIILYSYNRRNSHYADIIHHSTYCREEGKKTNKQTRITQNGKKSMNKQINRTNELHISIAHCYFSNIREIIIQNIILDRRMWEGWMNVILFKFHLQWNVDQIHTYHRNFMLINLLAFSYSMVNYQNEYKTNKPTYMTNKK